MIDKNDTEKVKEANQLIDEVDDAISNLSYFSVRNDDVFNGEIGRLEEEVKNCRKQLL